MFELFFNTIFINLIFLYFFLLLNNKFFNLNKLIFNSLISYHLFFTIIYIYHFQNDAADYKTYLNLTTFNGFNLSKLVSADLITSICAFFKNFLFFNDYNIILFFSLLSLSGIILFYKNLIKLGLEKKIAKFFLFIPGMHFWTCVPGKDSLILLLLALFFYFYLDKRIVLSSIFILGVFLLRPHIGFIFFTALIISEFIFIKGQKKILVLLLFASIIFLILNTETFSYFFVDEKILSQNILLKMFSHFNNYTGKFVFSTTGYESSNFLFNIFNYLVFPIEFIFRNNSFVVNLLIMTELVIFILVIHFILRSKKIVFDKKIFYFLLICCLIHFLIVPQALFNFGINTRQKWMILPFLIYFIFLLKNLLVKIKKI
tara:strand:- start:5254 stop:6372 length:1119 start_codon:yes stop_codon:yes gene_type:complete